MLHLVEKQDGKFVTKDFVVFNLDELRLKYPEGFQVYEAAIQFAKRNVEERSQKKPSGNYKFFFDPQQSPAPGISIRSRALHQKMREQSKVITQRLNEAMEKVKKAKETGKTDGLLEAIEAVEQARKNLQELENTIPTFGVAPG